MSYISNGCNDCSSVDFGNNGMMGGGMMGMGGGGGMMGGNMMGGGMMGGNQNVFEHLIMVINLYTNHKLLNNLKYKFNNLKFNNQSKCNLHNQKYK